MAVVNSNSTGIKWIVSPIRETLERRRAQQTIRDKAGEYHMGRIVLAKDGANVRVAFSKADGQDWASTLQSKIRAPSYIYCEARKTQDFLYMRVQDGQLREDRIVETKEELEQALLAVISGKEHHNVGSYYVEAFNMEGFGALYGLLENISDEQPVVSIRTSYIETLAYDDKFSFRSIDDGIKGLTNKILQITTVAAILCSVVAYSVVPMFIPQPVIEKVKTQKPYQTYTTKMLAQTSAAVRFAQDFNVQTMLREKLLDWRVYNVEYVPQGIFYSLYPVEMANPTVADLKMFAEQHNLQIVIKKSSIKLFVADLRAAPYMNADEVRRFNLDNLVINISDNLKQVTPYVKIQAGNKAIGDPMSSQEIIFDLSQGSDHDLLRLAALVDGFPHRYPILIEHGSYDITPFGEYSGQFMLSVHGEENPL